MKNKSSQNGIESGNHKRNIRRQIEAITDHPDFEYDPGEQSILNPTDNRPAATIYTGPLGYAVRMRFDVAWVCKCEALGIECVVVNQPPEDVAQALNDWISGHIDRPIALAAQLRAATPAVLELAAKYDISLSLALEMVEERAF